ncbi:MAG TPA: VOC family protein [Chitinophagaceae bacterium]|jgi:predicted enzyme related to lactoylglutathione lyase|nr:VOC family protein [Chitinophagaceae bacterium]
MPIMQLNHINLVVSNVKESIGFFETYFNFTCTDVKGDNVVAILKNAGGFTLVIMASKNEKPVYPQAFHIGFMLDSEAEVVQTYRNLENGGIAAREAPRKIRDSFGFYFNYDSIMIEVGHYVEGQ